VGVAARRLGARQDIGRAAGQELPRAGLNLLAEKAAFEDGSSGVEAGLFMMLERIQTRPVESLPSSDRPV
jgi:hypothetical protein